MGKHFRVLDQLMLSLLDKEATYDAGPALWTGAGAVQVKEFGEAYAEWPDLIRTDRDTVHGSQYATESEIIRQDVRIPYSEPRVRPTHLIGLAALTGGVLGTPLQDGALTAWRQKITPVAAAVALPSIAAQEKAHGIQYKYTGIKSNSLRLYKNGDFWAVDGELIGSGTRAAAADAFPAFLAEMPLRFDDTLCWLETGTDITIAAAPTQGSEDISGATPDDLRSRLRDAEFLWGNDLQLEDGYVPGGGNVRTRLDHGPARAGHMRVAVDVASASYDAELAYYTGQVNCALELECKSGTLIAATGAMYYGFDLIVPRFRLMPIKRSVVDGHAVMTLEGDLFDDGVNDPWILWGYCVQAAFLA
jgi:hypothetical protein